MKSFHAAKLALVLFLVPHQSSSQPNSLQPMVYSDLGDASSSDPLKSVVYQSDFEQRSQSFKKNARSANKKVDFPVLSLTEKFDDKTVIVSVALYGECDYGANNFGSEIEPALCKGNISIFDGDKRISSKSVDVCFAGHAIESVPRKNLNDDTFAEFDRKNRTVACPHLVARVRS